MSEYRAGSWTHPATLSDNISPDGVNVVKEPVVAMGDNGDAIIVWYQRYDSCLQILKSEYRSGSWVHPSDLSDNISPDGEDAMVPKVAMDDSGNTIIVWQQSNGSNNQIFMSEYRAGSWTHPSDLNDNISPDGTDCYAPYVAMDNNGSALIAWSQYDGVSNQLFKSEYRLGSWTHPADLNDNFTPDGTNASKPRIAMSSNGEAIIVWSQSTGAHYNIFKSEYRGGSWMHPIDLSDYISIDGEGLYDKDVAMDSSGNTIIVWSQSHSSVYQIFVAEYR